MSSIEMTVKVKHIIHEMSQLRRGREIASHTDNDDIQESH